MPSGLLDHKTCGLGLLLQVAALIDVLQLNLISLGLVTLWACISIAQHQCML